MAASRIGAAAPLSEREQQIAQLYIEGRTHKEIARSLAIAPSTVRTHLNAIYRKLEVTSRIELLRRFSGRPPVLADLRHRPAHGAPTLALGGQRAAALPGAGIGGPLPPPGLDGGAPFAASALDDALLQKVVDEKLKAIGIDVLRATGLLGDGLLEQAATHFVGVGGKRMAYRSMGASDPGGVPLMLLSRFRGSMDDWDPALVDAVEPPVTVASNLPWFGLAARTCGDHRSRPPQPAPRAAGDALDDGALVGSSSRSRRRSRPSRRSCATRRGRPG